MSEPRVVEGFAPFLGHQTWYRVTGDLKSGKAPLVVLHGGPGAAHNYVDSIKLIARQGRAVIHYDQLGCGQSTHLPDKGEDFWTVQLFLDELDFLLKHLGIRDAHHVLGQSWGGMLGAEYGVTRPTGLKSLVISDSPASMVLWVQEANKLRDQLPPDVQQTLLKHEAAGTTTSDEYMAAMKVFYDRHVCRVVPNPPEVQKSFAQIGEDPTVYFTMNGPSEFHVIGTLKDWSIVDRLERIAVPTLLVSGKYDEATPATVQPFADKIKNVRWQVFEHSSHMPHVEETELYMKSVGAFLDAND
jgi:L-proline amide hydrolase